MSNDEVRRHTLSVLVANEPGVTARVAGILSGRGFNIESFVGAEIDHKRHLSQITLVTSGTAMVIKQIKAQLERLVPIRRVRDLTEEGPHVTRELALVKVWGDSTRRSDMLRITESFGGRVIESSEAAVIFEITDSTEKVDQFLDLIEPMGSIEVARTGTIAISTLPGAPAEK